MHTMVGYNMVKDHFVQPPFWQDNVPVSPSWPSHTALVQCPARLAWRPAQTELSGDLAEQWSDGSPGLPDSPASHQFIQNIFKILSRVAQFK